MDRHLGAGATGPGPRGQSALRLVVCGVPPSPAAAPVRAAPLALPRDASLDDAVARILSSCLDQFVANWPSFRETAAPESVHQMRVALRRLRAAVGLVRRALARPDYENAATRAKAIADALGAARDWDVFSDLLEAGPRRALGDEPSYYALLDAVELRRAAAYKTARAVVDSPETSRFVADLRAALDRAPAPAAISARDFALRALDRLRKRALKTSKGLASRTADERHAARIALKKARYGAEFFESLFDGGARAYGRSLAKIQDRLGADTDMEMATRLLDEIDANGAGETVRASAFVRGWFAQAREEGAARAGKCEKALRKLEPFWR